MENEEAYTCQVDKEVQSNSDHPFGTLLVKDGIVVLTAVCWLRGNCWRRCPTTPRRSMG
ncbi:MAG: hypothetical protein IAE79_09060 [Anaerolinea sp.]|nr:hypothetical protein [Anaerolinea sp.]